MKVGASVSTQNPTSDLKPQKPRKDFENWPTFGECQSIFAAFEAQSSMLFIEPVIARKIAAPASPASVGQPKQKPQPPLPTAAAKFDFWVQSKCGVLCTISDGFVEIEPRTGQSITYPGRLVIDHESNTAAVYALTAPPNGLPYIKIHGDGIEFCDIVPSEDIGGNEPSAFPKM